MLRVAIKNCPLLRQPNGSFLTTPFSSPILHLRIHQRKALAIRRTGFHSQSSPLLKNEKDKSGESEKISESSTKTSSMEDNSTTASEVLEAESVISTEEITPRRRDSSAWARRSHQQQLQRSHKLHNGSLSKGSGMHASSFGRSFESNRDSAPSMEDENPTSPGRLNSIHSRTRLPSPKELKAYLDQYTIGQEKAKKHFSVAIYNHCVRLQDRLDRQEEEYAAMEFQEEAIQKTFREIIKDEDDQVLLEKSNVLLLGPTGSGKTLLAKVLARALDVPFTISDCTSMTQAGYIGEDVEVCIQRLAHAAEYDVDRIESGIVVLDEFDKLSKKQSFDSRRDVSGEGVQQALLKLVEGTKITLTVPYGSQSSSIGGSYGASAKNDTITVDTNNILFIFMGAFTGLDDIILEKLSKVDKPKVTLRDIFGRETTHTGSKVDSIVEGGVEVPIFDYTTHEDLVSYGIIPELAGRIPILVSTSQLSIEELQRVLTEPRNSVIKRYKLLFSKWGARLEFTGQALYQISKLCHEKGIGARGLTSIIDHLLVEPNYDSPHSGTKYILITEEVVKTMNNHSKRVQPLYFSSYETVAFLDAIEIEDPEYAHALSRELFPFQFGADKGAEPSKPRKKIAVSG